MVSALLWPIPALHLEAGSLLESARTALETETSLERAKEKIERRAEISQNRAYTLGMRAALLTVAAEAHDSSALETAEDMLLSAIEHMPENGQLWQTMGLLLLRMAESNQKSLPDLLRGAEVSFAKALSFDIALNRLPLLQVRLMRALLESGDGSVTDRTIALVDEEVAAAEIRYKAEPFKVITLLPLLDGLQVSARIDPGQVDERLRRIVHLLSMALPKLPELRNFLLPLAALLLTGAQAAPDEKAAFALTKQAALMANDAVSLLPESIEARALHAKALIEFSGYLDEADAARVLYVAIARFQETVEMTGKQDADRLITLGNAHLLHARLVRDGEADLHFADALAAYRAAATIRGHRHSFHEAIVHALLGEEEEAQTALENCQDLPEPVILLTLPGIAAFQDREWLRNLTHPRAN